MRPAGRMTIRGQAPAPQLLPGADLISKAEDVAVRHALMRAIEEVQSVPIDKNSSYPRELRKPGDVKAEILAALSRLRDEGADQ